MILESIKDIYLSNNKSKTWKHVQEVAETAVWLAEKYSLDTDKIKIAALLHDVSAILMPRIWRLWWWNCRLREKAGMEE